MLTEKDQEIARKNRLDRIEAEKRHEEIMKKSRPVKRSMSAKDWGDMITIGIVLVGIILVVWWWDNKIHRNRLKRVHEMTLIYQQGLKVGIDSGKKFIHDSLNLSILKKEKP